LVDQGGFIHVDAAVVEDAAEGADADGEFFHGWLRRLESRCKYSGSHGELLKCLIDINAM
jgi:hypothetical protein